MKRKLSVFLSLALLLSMALAGCKSDQTTPTTPADTTTPVTPATTPADNDTPAPAAEDFKFTENMTIIVPYKAGGGVDVAVRALLEAGLRDQLGTSVTVENVGGGNTLIGAQQVLGAPADGYTLFINTCAAFLAAPQMYDNPYTLGDWQYITTLGVTELLVAGGPSAPAATVDDLIAYGKSNPEGVTVGCAGYGDISALGAFITLQALGVKCQLVPYDGAAESVAACLGGHVQYVCATASTIASHCEEGTMTALYETGSLDDNSLGVPSISSLGYPEAATPYYRLVAVTKDVPADAVAALRAAFKAVLEDPDAIAKMAESKQIVQDVVNDPDELKALIEKDYAAYGEMVATLDLEG